MNERDQQTLSAATASDFTRKLLKQISKEKFIGSMEDFTESLEYPNELWPTIFDTRRVSQVICNKPRNLVKRII